MKQLVQSAFIKRILLLPVLVSVFLVAGCATPPSGIMPLPYSESEDAPYKKAGTGSLKGQAFLKTRGGDIKKGAGNNVYLMPATSYGTQRYEQIFVAGQSFSEVPDKRHGGSVRTTISDAEGRFEFKGLPAGKYYAFTTVTWEVPSTNQFMRGMMETQGGLIHSPTMIKEGETTEIILTR
jgi:hypothetical protein